MNETHKYDSIINLPYHPSKRHPHMTMAQRAAQFSPFATLTGHEDAILETQRLTEEWTPPTEEEAQHLNEQTAILLEQLRAGERPSVSIVYFQPDEKKSGGSYVTCSGTLRRIDEVTGLFIMTNGMRIDRKAISQILIPSGPSHPPE